MVILDLEKKKKYLYKNKKKQKFQASSQPQIKKMSKMFNVKFKLICFYDVQNANTISF